MAHDMKTGASASRTTADFNAKATKLSERLGAISKPESQRRERNNRWRSRPQDAVAAEASADAADTAPENEGEKDEAEKDVSENDGIENDGPEAEGAEPRG